MGTYETGPRRATGRKAVDSAFDQTNVTGPRALRRFLGCEFDALTLAQQLEHRAADRAAVEEVLDAAFISDEPEALVDQEASNCPTWHNPTPSVPNPQGNPKGTRPERLRAYTVDVKSAECPAG